MDGYDYLIVGAGFSGAVLAERLASQLGKTSLVVDRRNHVGHPQGPDDPDVCRFGRLFDAQQIQPSEHFDPVFHHLLHPLRATLLPQFETAQKHSFVSYRF